MLFVVQPTVIVNEILSSKAIVGIGVDLEHEEGVDQMS
jgi:hypothetical protein